MFDSLFLFFILLTDADECHVIPGLCRGGTCQNTVGSYRCLCPAGYVMNTLTQICEGKMNLF